MNPTSPTSQGGLRPFTVLRSTNTISRRIMLIACTALAFLVMYATRPLVLPALAMSALFVGCALLIDRACSHEGPARGIPLTREPLRDERRESRFNDVVRPTFAPPRVADTNFAAAPRAPVGTEAISPPPTRNNVARDTFVQPPVATNFAAAPRAPVGTEAISPPPTRNDVARNTFVPPRVADTNFAAAPRAPVGTEAISPPPIRNDVARDTSASPRAPVAPLPRTQTIFVPPPRRKQSSEDIQQETSTTYSFSPTNRRPLSGTVGEFYSYDRKLSNSSPRDDRSAIPSYLEAVKQAPKGLGRTPSQPGTSGSRPQTGASPAKDVLPAKRAPVRSRK
ncbi:MAG: hypothetical protein HW387_1044 [Parachlamydiales bacterium]|nr:hypothetical protein [Parachlamydiales bacterium]